MNLSETTAFTDPVFLRNFGLSRVTVLDYFLHPLNPFKSKNETCNEKLARQNISIGMLMERGTDRRPGPMTLEKAEEEYNNRLSHMKGEQYELLPPPHPTTKGGVVVSRDELRLAFEKYDFKVLVHMLGLRVYRTSTTTNDDKKGVVL